MKIKEQDYVLSHYGILGMRWGRRRVETSTSVPSEDHIRSREISKKKISEMSNKELEEVSRRLNLEKNYNQLTSANTSKGRKAVKDMWGVIAGVAAVTTTIITLANNGKKIVEKYNEAKPQIDAARKAAEEAMRKRM